MNPMQQVPPIPAHIQTRINERTKEGKRSALIASVVGAEQYPRVSIKGSRFRLIDDTNEIVVGSTLDVIFVGVAPRTSKIWFDKPYNSVNDAVRPVCWSINGLQPDDEVENPVSENCSTCPKNVLGSRKTQSGADSKECSDIWYVALLTASDPHKAYGLTIPVSSMKSFRQYFKDLNNYGVNPEEVITTLTFDDQVSYPKLLFGLKAYVPEKAIGHIEKMMAQNEVKIATRQLRASAPAALPAPEEAADPAAALVAAVTAAPAQAPAPAPAPAPAARRGRGKKAEAAAEQPPAAQDNKPDAAPSEPASDSVDDLEAELDAMFAE